MSHPGLTPVSHVSSEEAELQRQIAQLRAALQPFVDAMSALPAYVQGDDSARPVFDGWDITDVFEGHVGITLGMLRAARDALAEPGDLTRAEADELGEGGGDRGLREEGCETGAVRKQQRLLADEHRRPVPGRRARRERRRRDGADPRVARRRAPGRARRWRGGGQAAMPRRPRPSSKRSARQGPMSLEEAVAKVIARLQDRNAEVAALRQIISDAAREVGAQVSPECSLEFMALLPREVAMAIRRAESAKGCKATLGSTERPSDSP